MASEIETDADVGLAPPRPGLESDADVGMLESDADVGIASPKSWWDRGKVRPTALTMDSSLRTAPYVKEVIGAFGEGFQEGYGDHLDFTKGLIKYGQGGSYEMFGKEGGGYNNPFQAMNEILAHAIVGTAETALRIGGGLFRGAQSAVFDATGSRDLAAIPEAFFGTPHPFGIRPPAPLERVYAGRIYADSPDIGRVLAKEDAAIGTHVAGALLKEEGVTIAEIRGPAHETAAVPGFDVFHASPHDFPAVAEITFKDGRPSQTVPLGEALDPALIEEIKKGDASVKEHPFGKFDIRKIGTGEGAQSYGYGLYFAENQAVAGEYQKALVRGDALRFSALTDKQNAALGDSFPAHLWASADADVLQSAIQNKRDQLKLSLDRRRADIAEMVRDGQNPDIVERLQKRATDYEGKLDAFDALIASGDVKFSEPIGNLYQVRILADREHFLDWDKPLSEQAQVVQDALAKSFPDEPYQFEWTYKSRDSGSAWVLHERGETLAVIEPRGKDGFRVQSDSLDKIVPTFEEAQRLAEQKVGPIKTRFPDRNPTKGQDIWYQLHQNHGNEASNMLHEAGIPGIKYLDQGSRATATPTRALQRALEEAKSELQAAQGDGIRTAMAQIKLTEIEGLIAGPEKQTSNFVVFNDSLIEITHKNGEPLTKAERADLVREPQKPVDMDQARDLGVVGPEHPEPTFKDSPSELADNAVPRSLSSAETPEDMKGPTGHGKGEYDARGKEWIDKIDEPEDVRGVIEKIAADHDWFPEARAGVASPAARDEVAKAAGIDPAKLDETYFGTHFDNDGKVRAVIQVLRQTAKDVVEASERNIKEPSVENAAALAEAEMRHGHVVEYTMGLRAESGRSLAAWKDLLRQTEHTKAQVQIKAKEQTGELPTGTAGVVDTANDVAQNLKTPGKKPGLMPLIEAAQELVDGEAKAPSDRASTPQSPEVKGLVDEAKNVLKRFGVDKDAGLEKFREQLQRLAEGSGKLGDTVDAARELLKGNEKPPKPASGKPPKPPSDRGRLMGAAKRLVEASDGVEAKPRLPISEEMQGMMEAARQAVGRLKSTELRPELTEFRDALNSKDADRAVDAANRLIEAEAKPSAPSAPKPPVEFDQVMSAARRVANAAKEAATKEKAELPPDIKDVLNEAKSAVSELQASRKSELGKLIDTAEKQAINMTKQKAVKKPVEALPPELQALVDKAERVTDRFGGIARGERAALLLAQTGRTLAEQEQLARSVAGLTPNQVAKVLEKLRSSAEARKPGWFYWLWQQGLISGLITHIGYGLVNTATVFAERVVSPFFGAALGKARGQNVSVMAPLYANVAMIHALPDALTAAGEAFRTGNRIPLASELRLFERGEESPQTKGASTAYMQAQSPEWGIWKRVFNEDQLDTAARALGIPGRAANLMHTFFKVLSERASGASRAFEEAHSEGVRGEEFWRRYDYHLANPTDDALRATVTDAYTGAFMSKLGGETEKWAQRLKGNPITKWMFPFQHIPWNIQRMTFEYSPLAVLGPEMRAAILGEKGAPAQNLAIAKMAVGSSIIGYFLHKGIAGDATGDYPTDAKERNKWHLLGIQANSIKVGNSWVNLERLGPVGNIAHLGASLGEIIKNYDGEDDGALTKAIWSASMAAANQIANEVGFQTLRNLIDAMHSEKKAEQFVASQGASFVYPSSFLGQNASIIDPYQRQAASLVAGLKYKIPLLRETLPPKLDPLYGTPLPNPGYHAIKRTSLVNDDPIKAELANLKIYPVAPQDRIGGVKLPPNLYDRYQTVAGAFTRSTLETIVSQPGWQELPTYVREQVFRKTIAATRQAAAATMQATYPQIIQQGIDNRVNHITGQKATKLKELAD